MEGVYSDPIQGEVGNKTWQRLNLRRQYAMRAMQGMLSDYKHGEEMMQTYPDPNRDAGSVLALASFLIADAMIEFEEKEYEEKRKAEEAKEA